MTTTDYLLARLCVDLEKMLTDPPKTAEIRSVLKAFDTMTQRAEKKAEKAANTPREQQLSADTQEVYFYYPCECNSPSYYKIKKTTEDFNRLHDIIRREGKEPIMNAMKDVVDKGSYIPSLSKFIDQYTAPKPIVMEEHRNKPTYQDVR